MEIVARTRANIAGATTLMLLAAVTGATAIPQADWVAALKMLSGVVGG